MATDEISNEDEVSRGEAADRLEAIAQALRADGEIDFEAGNKTITFSPPDSVSYKVAVREESSILRSRRETAEITLSWRPE
jgi:amphi-Trp domain-containing protein